METQMSSAQSIMQFILQKSSFRENLSDVPISVLNAPSKRFEYLENLDPKIFKNYLHIVESRLGNDEIDLISDNIHHYPNFKILYRCSVDGLDELFDEMNTMFQNNLGFGNLSYTDIVENVNQLVSKDAYYLYVCFLMASNERTCLTRVLEHIHSNNHFQEIWTRYTEGCDMILISDYLKSLIPHQREITTKPAMELLQEMYEIHETWFGELKNNPSATILVKKLNLNGIEMEHCLRMRTLLDRDVLSTRIQDIIDCIDSIIQFASDDKMRAKKKLYQLCNDYHRAVIVR
jgi:hypothetical protein